jgi:hypothetical protein
MAQRVTAPDARFGAAVPAETARERALFHAGNVQRITDFSEQIAMSIALQSERPRSAV